MLESFLEKNEFFAGENMTIADYSIAPSVTTAMVSKNIKSEEKIKIFVLGIRF